MKTNKQAEVAPAQAGGLNKGCGKPIRVIGTNGGTMACGATLRHGKELAVHYCSDCEHRMRQAAIDAALDDAPAQAGGHTPILLYYHKTDGGAEYLTDKFVECPNGHKEGVFEGASYIARLDGQPKLTRKNVPDTTPALLAALEDCNEQLGRYLQSVEDGKDDDAESAYQFACAAIAAAKGATP